MSDSTMIDRWNVINAARMAVGVEGVLSRIMRKKPMPFDFDESIDEGIAFLDEAEKGGSILCGNLATCGFSGTLSPLNLSTEILIRFNPQDEKDDLYKEIVSFLAKYKEVLGNIKKGESESNSAKDLEPVCLFFKSLGNIMLSQADPINKTFSRQLS